MPRYSTWWYKKFSKFTAWFSCIQWTDLVSRIRGGKPGHNLTDDDWELLKVALASEYYIILTRRKTHLTTYTIALMTWIKTGKWPQYSHALMNLDLVSDPENFERFKLMEATSKGVHFSRFEEVFDCDYVCLLQPLNVDNEEWTEIMRGLALQLGKPYDNLFNVYDDSHVSCVEMCLAALWSNPNHGEDFPMLREAIDKERNLTPQMFRDSPDFKVILEIKR
jgi:hypothetical protein